MMIIYFYFLTRRFNSFMSYIYIIIYHGLCWTSVTMFISCVVCGRNSCKIAPGWWVILVKYVLKIKFKKYNDNDDDDDDDS